MSGRDWDDTLDGERGGDEIYVDETPQQDEALDWDDTPGRGLTRQESSAKLSHQQHSPYKHTYLFKAAWRATAITFHVQANSTTAAYKKAEAQVKRMQGGSSVMDLILLAQLR